MGNIGKLMDAGIISAGAALSQEDQNVINSLTPDEVSALISIKAKLTPGFIQRNLSGSPTRGEQSMGIVF
jgi:hypothetical protein